MIRHTYGYLLLLGLTALVLLQCGCEPTYHGTGSSSSSSGDVSGDWDVSYVVTLFEPDKSLPIGYVTIGDGSFSLALSQSGTSITAGSGTTMEVSGTIDGTAIAMTIEMSANPVDGSGLTEVDATGTVSGNEMSGTWTGTFISTGGISPIVDEGPISCEVSGTWTADKE